NPARAPRPAVPAVLPRRRGGCGYPGHRPRARGVAPHRRGPRRADRLRPARPRHALLVRPAARSCRERASVTRLRSLAALGGAAMLLVGVLGLVPGATTH